MGGQFGTMEQAFEAFMQDYVPSLVNKHLQFFTLQRLVRCCESIDGSRLPKIPGSHVELPPSSRVSPKANPRSPRGPTLPEMPQHVPRMSQAGWQPVQSAR